METSICYTDRETAYISSDERRWINRIRLLAEEHPDDVVIKYQPETNDGCICATIPVSWVKVNPPRKLEMTDERRQALGDRMRELNQKHSVSLGN